MREFVFFKTEKGNIVTAEIRDDETLKTEYRFLTEEKYGKPFCAAGEKEFNFLYDMRETKAYTGWDFISEEEVKYLFDEYEGEAFLSE